MIKASIPQIHYLEDKKCNFLQNPELSFNLREKECVSFIKKCKNIRELKQVHAQILKLGMFWSSFCASNLIATCAISDWGSMDYACSIFRQIEEPGSFAFNHMIRGHVKDFNLEEALLIYADMLDFDVKPDNFTYPSLIKACACLPALKEGKQIHGHCFKFGFVDDVFVQNSLINMYGKCGEIGFSSAVFENIERKTIASWSALIAAHANSEMWDKCLEILKKMNNENVCKAEESTLVTVLSACTHLGDLNLGRSTHAILTKTFLGLNVTVDTSLIDMYVNCGFLDKGLYIFENMAQKNQLSYSVMISGLALHGRGFEALRLFDEMLNLGIKPDKVVYIDVLSACSHNGLVEEGLHFFENMKVEHKIEPTLQHYGCIVDLMGRKGMVNEAYEFIISMPIEPNNVIWRSLLSSSKIHQNVEMGEIAAKSLFQMNSHNASDYVTLSNIYAKSLRWDEVAKVRTEIVNRGLIQTPGFSIVRLRKKVYKFCSQDMKSPQCAGVYEMLYQMDYQLKLEGYCSDISQVLFDVEEEEKRERLTGHSQKMAIAFAMINTTQGTLIRIVSNIRMCSDCHTYTKFVSKIYKREIVIRGRNRFHHFVDGTCSCRDYW